MLIVHRVSRIDAKKRLPPSDNDRLAAVFRMIELLDLRKEAIDVKVEHKTGRRQRGVASPATALIIDAIVQLPTAAKRAVKADSILVRSTPVD